MTTKSNQSGFSILELMVVVAVVIATLAMTLPTVTRAQQIYRLSAAANGLRSQLSYARIQAISRNTSHRIRVVDSTTYVMERWVTGSWVVAQTFSMADGFAVAASGDAQFQSRGNANAPVTFTLTNPSAETRQIAVETSGYVHAL